MKEEHKRLHDGFLTLIMPYVIIGLFVVVVLGSDRYLLLLSAIPVVLCWVFILWRAGALFIVFGPRRTPQAPIFIRFLNIIPVLAVYGWISFNAIGAGDEYRLEFPYFSDYFPYIILTLLCVMTAQSFWGWRRQDPGGKVADKSGQKRNWIPQPTPLYCWSILASSFIIFSGYDDGMTDMRAIASFLPLLALWSVMYSKTILPWKSSMVEEKRVSFSRYAHFIVLLGLSGLIGYSGVWNYWSAYPFLVVLMLTAACYSFVRGRRKNRK